jgi:hypothetical protein
MTNPPRQIRPKTIDALRTFAGNQDVIVQAGEVADMRFQRGQSLSLRAGAFGDRLKNPDAKVEGKGFRHVRRPPSPADILNQIRPPMGIPNDSVRWASALINFCDLSE